MRARSRSRSEGSRVFTNTGWVNPPGKVGLSTSVSRRSSTCAQRGRVAAPERLRRGEPQLFAEQRAGDARQVRQKRRALHQTGAERVGDRDVPLPHGLHQARHAQHRLRPQLERIAVVVVHPAQDHVDRLQSAQRLQVHAVVAHGEVGAADQGVAEVLREVGLLEVGGVVRPRRQQHDARDCRG